jgi:hypothetical protein
MIDNKPMLPCPPWCEVTHKAAMTSHQLHRYTGDEADGTIMITLFMHDCGTKYADVLAQRNGDVDLHISTRGMQIDWPAIVRPASEARGLADMAIAFGREDVAAAIVELAALIDRPVTDSLPSDDFVSHG